METFKDPPAGAESKTTRRIGLASLHVFDVTRTEDTPEMRNGTKTDITRIGGAHEMGEETTIDRLGTDLLIRKTTRGRTSTRNIWTGLPLPLRPNSHPSARTINVSFMRGDLAVRLQETHVD
jgi:hypothetical protein